MNQQQPFMYPMDSATNKEISDAAVARAVKHLDDMFDYYLKHTPGLTQKSGRERLAFYRTTDQAYWDQLAQVNLSRAKHNMMDWAALDDAEARGKL